MRLCPTCQHEIKDKEQMRFCSFCGEPVAVSSDDRSLIGRVLGGKYRIELLISRDRGDHLYKGTAIAAQSDVMVAVQVVELDQPLDPETIARLSETLQKASEIRHKNLAQVIDWGVADWMAYAVTEFPRVTPLDSLLSMQPKLPLPQVLNILKQTCSALEALHSAGIIHGDLAPEKLWLVKKDWPLVKVTGFGLQVISAADHRERFEEHNESMVGAGGYLSPEQYRGEAPIPQSDIYSLGVIAYEMLRDHIRFEKLTSVEALTRRAPEIGAESKDLAKRVEEVITRAISADPSKRQRSAAELADEFEIAFGAVESGLPTHDTKITGVNWLGIDFGTCQQPLSEIRIEPQHPRLPLRWERIIAYVPSRQADTAEPVLDEDVQFTVYRPNTVQPLVWSTMLAFAHLSERRPDAQDSEPDPLEEVKRQAQQILGQQVDQYQKVIQDSSQAVPREGQITMIPLVPGIEFNPSSRSFKWKESVHREEFRLRAAASLDGQHARGRLSVFLGSILLADVTLSVRVDSSQPVQSEGFESASARRYRKIFASYSHKDAVIVEQFERFAKAFGDQYLRDVNDLRAGEVWTQRLEAMITDADIFQLFWSTNSMNSAFVRQEWEYALALARQNFIRPTYWEEPLPTSPERNLPPEELVRLHFQRITPGFRKPPRLSAALGQQLESKGEFAFLNPPINPAARSPRVGSSGEGAPIRPTTGSQPSGARLAATSPPPSYGRPSPPIPKPYYGSPHQRQSRRLNPFLMIAGLIAIAGIVLLFLFLLRG